MGHTEDLRTSPGFVQIFPTAASTLFYFVARDEFSDFRGLHYPHGCSWNKTRALRTVVFALAGCLAKRINLC